MHIYIDDKSNPMKEFLFPDDSSMELSRTNPFLSEEGSQSIPLTLPPSKNNMQLLNFIYRTNPSKRPTSKIPVILAEGTEWMKATLYIEKTNQASGIDCTIYTSEGQLNEKIKDYKIDQLDWPKLEGQGGDITAKARYWMNTFARMQMGLTPQADQYFVFCAETSSVFNVKENPGVNTELVLNETKYKDSTISFWAMDEQKYTTSTGQDQIVYTAPVGYGITPFLRLGYVLRHIFYFFGYTLPQNIFDTDVSLKRLVIINNVADAIVNGTIRFEQLLPTDVSVEEFINSVCLKFGVEFIESGKQITIRAWDAVLKESPDMDLTSFLRGEISTTIQSPINISMKLDLLGRESWSNWLLKPIFSRSSKKGIEEKEINPSDKTPLSDVVYSPYLHRDHNYTVTLEAPFIGDIQNKNTELVLSTGETDEETEADCPIMYCFSNPRIQTWSSEMYPVIYKYYTGTIFSNDKDGYKWGTLSLVVNSLPEDWPYNINLYTDNLYNVFYKIRDAMLQKANQPLSFNALIPMHTIQRMDITRPKVIKGQRIMIERIDYIMNKQELCLVTARTLHELKDE